jgi:Tfp pilus assembly protein PilO
MRIERDQGLTLLALLGIVGVFAAFRAGPGWVQRTRLQMRINQASAQLTDDPASIRRLGALAHEVGELQRVADEPLREIPREAELAGLLRRLSAELENGRVNEQELHTDPVVAGRGYSVIPVAVTFSSGFPAAFEFLDKVESMPRLVRVTKLNFSGDTTKGNDSLKVRVEVCAFFTPGASGAPSDSAEAKSR